MERVAVHQMRSMALGYDTSLWAPCDRRACVTFVCSRAFRQVPRCERKRLGATHLYLRPVCCLLVQHAKVIACARTGLADRYSILPAAMLPELRR